MQEIPYGYCHCGCGQKTTIAPRTHRAKGWVKGEPLAVKLGHGPIGKLLFERGSADECWVWRGWLNAGGYGYIRRQGRSGYAHRYVYEQERGPIPEGMQLDHLCRNRACVNPDHLEPVTTGANTRRGKATKRTPYTTFLIRLAEASTTLSRREIADMIGVSRSIVQYVNSGRACEHLA